MIIFLAATSAALLINLAGAWLAYRAISNMSAAANEKMNRFRKSGAREWIQSLESVSTHAAEVSSEIKTDILNLEPALLAAQEKLTHSLARIDHSCDRTCNAVTNAMNQAGKVATRGSWLFDRMFSGARAASAIVRSVRSVRAR